ncbi:hypothetical protein BDV95DRAFT_579632 [Massariosphaeria phaeospora]|uniref:Transmembrane protein n=1 Tax=Massariosphaeria phaeospora TaxID=100035 RepID=A0A7C8MFS9_9PLEO|nr:hypothetical protein BDV95DRAFT_579632 [Massariosphaeria phaeospora]
MLPLNPKVSKIPLSNSTPTFFSPPLSSTANCASAPIVFHIPLKSLASAATRTMARTAVHASSVPCSARSLRCVKARACRLSSERRAGCLAVVVLLVLVRRLRLAVPHFLVMVVVAARLWAAMARRRVGLRWDWARVVGPWGWERVVGGIFVVLVVVVVVVLKEI